MNENLRSQKPALRYCVKQPINFWSQKDELSSLGELHNISSSGAFLQTPQRLEEGEEVLVELSAQGKSSQIRATIVWRNHLGCGICFLFESPLEKKVVRALINTVADYNKSSDECLERISAQLQLFGDVPVVEECSDWGVDVGKKKAA